MAESKVRVIVKALSGLEDDLDSLSVRLAEMKKNIGVKTQNEIDGLLVKTRDMAAKEAEEIITEAKTQAESESSKISEAGEAKLSEMRSKIDAEFDGAVRHVVSSIMKPGS